MTSMDRDFGWLVDGDPRRRPLLATLTNGQRQNAKDHTQGHLDRLANERESLTPAEIDERLIKAIVTAIIERGIVTAEDLRLANVPAEAIKRRAKACFALACEREPRLRHMLRNDPS